MYIQSLIVLFLLAPHKFCTRGNNILESLSYEIINNRFLDVTSKLEYLLNNNASFLLFLSFLQWLVNNIAYFNQSVSSRHLLFMFQKVSSSLACKTAPALVTCNSTFYLHGVANYLCILCSFNLRKKFLIPNL